MKRLLLAPLTILSISLIGNSKVLSDDFLKNFFNDEALRIQVSSDMGLSLEEVNSEFLEEVRLGFCNAYTEYPDMKWPNRKIKNYCLSLPNKKANNNRDALRQKDAHSICRDARDYQGCMNYIND